MGLTAIILLIITGVILIVLEMLVVPGGVVGIIGFGMVIFSIILSYNISNDVGNWVLASTIVFLAVITYLTLKSKTWEWLMLKTTVDSKTNKEVEQFQVGDKGKTISRLMPTGKALINNQQVEVHALGGTINENQEIEIIKILDKKIYVQLIKTN